MFLVLLLLLQLVVSSLLFRYLGEAAAADTIDVADFSFYVPVISLMLAYICFCFYDASQM